MRSASTTESWTNKRWGVESDDDGLWRFCASTGGLYQHTGDLQPSTFVLPAEGRLAPHSDDEAGPTSFARVLSQLDQPVLFPKVLMAAYDKGELQLTVDVHGTENTSVQVWVFHGPEDGLTIERLWAAGSEHGELQGRTPSIVLKVPTSHKFFRVLVTDQRRQTWARDTVRVPHTN
jgi:hypothetical protein